MENLFFMLAMEPDETDKESLEKLNTLLSRLNINFEFRKVKENHFLKINYDTDDVQRIFSRGAGRPQKFVPSAPTVAEIRERMKTETAEDVAKSLGLSRSTFFRKLKWAEENDMDYFV